MAHREAWLAVVEDGRREPETELVTVTGGLLEPGATIETTDGRRITLTERAGESPDLEAA